VNIDERIQALAMHLEVLTHMHQDFEKRMTQYSADLKDAIARLTDIAAWPTGVGRAGQAL
jgi:hypothetical protein